MMGSLSALRLVAALLAISLRGTEEPPVPHDKTCLIGDELATRVAAVVQQAERSRLVHGRTTEGLSGETVTSQKSLDCWIDIVVEACPVGQAMGVTFYRSYNNLIDPPPIYVVAVDREGSLYRISGFDASEYTELSKRWAARATTLTDSEALEVVATYFSLVEAWRPGVVESAGDLAAVSMALSKRDVGETSEQEPKGCLRVPEVVRKGGAVAVWATLFDKKSSRAECVYVELSGARGLVVRSRKVLVDRPRLEY